MRVTNAFLANYAEQRDGLAFISAAFPEWYSSSALPFKPRIGLVMVIEYDRADLGMSYGFLVNLVHPNGDADTVVTIGVTHQLKVAHPLYAPIIQVVTVASMQVEFRYAGPHEFRIIDRETREQYYSINVGVTKGAIGGPDWPLTPRPS